MIQTLEDMMRIVCAYGLEFKVSDAFNHHWCTLIPAFELFYKNSIHASIGKTPAILGKGWNPKLSVYTLKIDLVDIHQNASSVKLLLNKESCNSNESMTDAFGYAKQKWDKVHNTTEFKVGDLILASTLKFENMKGQKKLKYSFEGPFIIKAFYGTDEVQVELTGELENKYPSFPVILINNGTSSKEELFPFRNETPLEVLPLDRIEEKNMLKVLKERSPKGRNERDYLVRYRNPQHEGEWLSESRISYPQNLLRTFRHERRPISQ
ncbi:hypothetical protein O181_068958 [Austropuccinia psidii MF-1]|uniref:Integrase catalytic domain-containing protein n=1 Tax=Austropuccinia psidii MF-1 TaxID=1389203 RepID=A0A9Q3F1C4_9BASI|nr:hypothetical protein [Austropuccinia psidii MF-1]